LTAYPLAFPQLARMATGLSVSDPEFQEQRDRFLRQFAAAFQTGPFDEGKENSK
jgi:hypothetical protein